VPGGRRKSRDVEAPVDEQWLRRVGSAAAASSGAPVGLLGGFLPMLAEAAVHGRRPQAHELDAVRRLGTAAAEQGVGAGLVVELYLSAAWRLWRELPVVMRSGDSEKVRAAAEAVLRVVDDAVAALVESHQRARRESIRHEEALRREFVDDLLRGDGDVSRMVVRAEPFGIDLAAPHHVALVARVDRPSDVERATTVLERGVVDGFGDRDVLVATKDGRVVVLVPGALGTASADRALDVGRTIRRELDRLGPDARWRVAAGRAFAGAYGVARSYEEAREALTLADRLHLAGEILDVRDVLVYRVLGRDQAAIVDLVRDVLGPLEHLRSGPGTLLDTLGAYFAAGEVATEAARRLHVSVRTVTYRLARVAELTGYSPARPDQRFSLHAAVLGARLLDWPAIRLPVTS
jgi:sugar diacid utilization regulator